MNIQIDGTNSLNKGAELMFFAVLHQIKKFDPQASVFFNSNQLNDSGIKLDSELDVRSNWFNRFNRVPVGLLKRLGLPYAFLTSKNARRNIDLVLDAAGFQFSDQWNYSKKSLDILENYYCGLKDNGTRIVFLPQAFGPFATTNGIRSVSIVNKYVDLIYAREKISYDFLIGAGCDPKKVRVRSDFTLLLDGVFPNRFEHLKGKVCLIPNRKMITHVSNGQNVYLRFMQTLAYELQKRNLEFYILNHEGEGDYEICKALSNSLPGNIEVVNKLGALEVKGLIGSSNMVISSRYHGVASALNQGVPALATSWNHKYEMIFDDFGMKDCVLNIEERSCLGQVIDDFLSRRNLINSILTVKKAELASQTERMWQEIWKFSSDKNSN
ncbi:hypothetical protein ADIS_2032 [Lunatimonas lonarensis]|uniref:Polysaccharide pyruvyl transferase domain-containing protein n=1 Tax=Lunatimonas lonarensis TaxID=1232681 RepID=R7ZTU5_9BACT|nr:polysaccharide pyruvyl transferase family protein [Lunatimonas lonarensis]EON77502.1 hypothetical protein ADIS_2032 [Lunatimonas lonarensis]